ncbi:MAG TPA: Mpo1-like protein, partial [Polyangiaceae bacterium]|nr:Mpo1-like protein [Polyangiaceae bacterium]
MPRRTSTATLGVALSAAGMGALCAGFKLSALSLFGAGIKLLEQDWRARHPEFTGNAAERWQASLAFYRETHQNGTNRTLHLIGIPLILGGAAGLFVSKPLSARGPLWVGSLAAFTAGW